MAIVAAMEVEPLPTASIESWTPQVIHSNHPSVVYLVKITNASGELNDKIKEINSLNVVTAGQKETIARLMKITSIDYNHVNQAKSAPALMDQQGDIFEAFLRFFSAEQAMLTTLSGKHGLFEAFHFLTGPTAAALRSLKIVLDKNIVDIMSLVPKFADEVRQSAAVLDQVLGNAINLYSGLVADS